MNPDEATAGGSAETAPLAAGHGDAVEGARTVVRPANRRDIDGLRALAVLPVILFHAGVTWFPGGFVGVDVFFVISGYLITCILHGEMTRGGFSLPGFYERRARRILPALFVVMTVVTIAGWLLFLAKDFEDVGQSLIGTSLFAANIVFYFKTGYFEAPALSKPLLHMWSLGVEEQFYILFPLLLWALLRWRPRQATAIVAALAAGSLALSAWGAYHHPSETFYLPVTRAWELMIGSILAMGLAARRVPRAIAEAMGVAGLALLAGSILLLNGGSIFPGLGALPACLGAALLIYAGIDDTLTARLLGWRPLVGVGLISYSLYLWHWPAIVFLNYRSITPAPPLFVIATLAAVFVVSAASWRYVEAPFRKGHLLKRRNRLFAAAASAIVLFTAAGVVIQLAHGFSSRLPPEVRRLEHERFDTPDVSRCVPLGSIRSAHSCGQGNRFIVWGDSHAEAMVPAVRDIPGSLTATVNGCPPALGLSIRGFYAPCDRFNEAVLRLVRDRSIGTIFLVANWPAYYNARRFEGGTLEDGMARTFAALRGRKVYVMLRVPGATMPVAVTLAKAALFGVNIDVTRATPDYVASQRRVRDLARDERILLPQRYLCNRARCPVMLGRTVLYADDTHVTPAGARLLTPMFERALAEGGSAGAP